MAQSDRGRLLLRHRRAVAIAQRVLTLSNVSGVDCRERSHRGAMRVGQTP